MDLSHVHTPKGLGLITPASAVNWDYEDKLRATNLKKKPRVAAFKVASLKASSRSIRQRALVND